MSARPGFVLEVDRSTPPTLFWRGDRVGTDHHHVFMGSMMVGEPLMRFPNW